MALAPEAKTHPVPNRLTRPNLARERAPRHVSNSGPTAPTVVETATPRCCALFLAGFPAWALARMRPELKEQPFAVVSAGKMVALSPQAHALGIEQNWSVARMRALHPEVLIQPRHPARETVAWEQVLTYLARLSPYVESIRPGLALLDLPNPQALQPLLQHLQAQGGVGYDRASAEMAALCAERGALLSAQSTQRFLSRIPLPMLGAVGVSKESIERLSWFGWRSIGDLRGLTRHHLESQFADGALIYRYAQTQDTRPISAYKPEAKLTARLAFEEPVREPAEWQGALDCLLTDLTTALGERKPYSITVSIETSEGRRHERYFLREATASRRTLTAAAERLLLTLLGDGAALQAIRVALGGFVTTRPHQTSLFETGKQAASSDLTETLYALEARYPGLVRHVRVTLPDAYLPEERFEWGSLIGRDLGGDSRPRRGRHRA